MKKIFVALMMLAILFMTAPANASGNSGDKPDVDNKKVTLCHATGSEKNPYVKITVSVNAFVQAGHGDHEGDIFEQIVYITKAGDTVIIPAQGNTDLLAFDDCEKPKVDEQITLPVVEVVDKCGVADDKVLVPSSNEYTSKVTYADNVATVVFTAAEGFTFAEGKTVTKTFTFVNNENCDLPETGGATTFVLGGVLALGLMTGAGVMLARTRKTV